MSKSILLLGTGPLLETEGLPFGFPQIRFWSIKKALESAGHRVHAVNIGHDTIPNMENVNPDMPTAASSIESLSLGADAVISAGPFLPALAASWSHSNRPLWIDWPSDPLADWNARINALDSEWTAESEAAVIEVVAASLGRADAFGVISKRQKWATLGQLLLIGRHTSPLQNMINICPVAYDFPHEPLTRRSRQKNDVLRVIICGTANAWFDDEMATDGLGKALSSNPNLEVVWTGGPVAGHYEAGWQRIEHWAKSMGPRVKAYKRPNKSELIKLISNCHVGIWCDKDGVEPLLGSRTRALFMAWMGLELIGSMQCELSIHLNEMGLLKPANSADELARRLQELQHSDLPMAPLNRHRLLLENYGPQQVYLPIIEWLEAPQAIDGNSHGFAALTIENRRLRQKLAEIHNSPTWRAGATWRKLTHKLSGKSTE